MSEQSPYAAPVPTPGMYPPPGVPMNPPAGFMPPPPPPGYAPPPAVPAQAQPGQPADAYHSPAMTLTELSFAPLPSEAPPAPVAVMPPPPAAPQLVMDVLPAGGISRGLPRGGGRTPLIALVLVLLLAAAGVFFGTDLLRSSEEPPPVVPAAKNAAKAPVKPLVGKTVSVSKKSSGTLGGTYTITAPTGWTVKQNAQLNGQRADIHITHPSGQNLAIVSVNAGDAANGALGAADLAEAKEGFLSGFENGQELPGAVKTTIAGMPATGFDVSQTQNGVNVTLRAVFFVRNGTGYAVMWAAGSDQFAKSLTTFDSFLATVKFA